MLHSLGRTIGAHALYKICQASRHHRICHVSSLLVIFCLWQIEMLAGTPIASSTRSRIRYSAATLLKDVTEALHVLGLYIQAPQSASVVSTQEQQ